ncbi:MAG: DUF3021 family protein, partial [Fusobacteriota bacterium]
MKKLKSFVLDIFASALIGIFVGGSYLMVILGKYIGYKNVLISLGLSALIGIIIGLTASFVFKLVRYNIIKNMKIAYILEILVVMVMTGIASYFMNVHELKFIIGMTLIACTLAFFFTLYQDVNEKKTNKKLKDIQEELKKG